MPTAGGDAPHAIGIVSSLVAGVGIWDFDLRRGTLECDAGWYRIMGRDPEQPVRSLAGFRPLIHPEDVDRATEVEQTAGGNCWPATATTASSSASSVPMARSAGCVPPPA